MSLHSQNCKKLSDAVVRTRVRIEFDGLRRMESSEAAIPGGEFTMRKDRVAATILSHTFPGTYSIRRLFPQQPGVSTIALVH